jgi:hypothetical protein
MFDFFKRIPGARKIEKLRDTLRHLSQGISHLNRIESMRFMDVELPKDPRYADPRRLLQYQHQTCSQSGEDGVIREIFRRIGTTDKVFVEAGVGDGCENNTALLLSRGWTGYWIDASNEFVQNVSQRADLEYCLKWSVSSVTRENIGPLLKSMGAPKEFDLLSLDIDQNTYYAWEGMREYRPRVAVLEYNAMLASDVNWKVRYDPNRIWNGTHNYGASLKALELLGKELGYSLVSCESSGNNAFFVRNELVGDKFASPFTAENHYEPPRFNIGFRRSHPSAILDRNPDVGE